MKRTQSGSPRQLSVKIVTSSGDVMCSSRLPCHHLSCHLVFSLPSSAFLFRWLLFPSMPIIIQIWLPLHTSTNLSKAHENQPVSLCGAFWLCCRKQPDFHCLFLPTSQGKSHPLIYFPPSSTFPDCNNVAVPRAQVLILLLGKASGF